VNTWKQHPRFASIEVSDDGLIRRTNRQPYSLTKDKDGYVQVGARVNGRRVTMKVHRAVAETFIGPVVGMDVNHLNGVKDDNRVCNLQICTKSENHFHARRVLGQLVGERNGCAKLTNQQAQEIYNAMRRGEKAKDIAARHGVQPKECRRILRGERWAHVVKRDEQENKQ
jgi:hypothetical protein